MQEKGLLRVKKRRQFTVAFKKAAVERLAKTDNGVSLARELGINRRMLYRWRAQRQAIEAGRQRERGDPQQELRQVKLLLAEKTLEADFFKSALQKSRSSTAPSSRSSEIREVMPFQAGLSIERTCQLAQVSRAAFYRWFAVTTKPDQ